MSDFPKSSLQAQFFGQCVIAYIMDLFTGTPKEKFTRDEILMILDSVRDDSDLFSKEAILAHEAAEHETQE